MRPIKFRAWDRNLKKWCDGNDSRGFNLFGETLLIGGILQDGYYSHNVFERLFSDVEIMQFTGLKDKGGSDVFEGDVVRCVNGHIGEVVWEEQDACFNVDGYYCASDDYPSMAFIEGGPFIILGNRYENPELLEKK